MKGLLLKEWYGLTAYRKNFFALLAVVLVACLLLRNHYTFVPMMLVMYALIMTMSFYQLDEKTGWDKFVVATPASRRLIMASKYLFLVLMMLVVLIFGYALGAVVAIIQGESDWPMALAAVCGVMMLMYLFIHSLTAPIAYKFGAEKSRLIMMAVFAVPYVAGIYLAGRLTEAVNMLSGVPTMLIAGVAVVLCVGMYMISWRVSSRIYAAKEF